MKKSNFLYGLSVVLILFTAACQKDDNPTPSTKKIETGTFTDISTTEVGAAGTTIAVTGGVLKGMSIEIPPRSYPTNKTFTIGSAEIISHKFGPDFNPITPMIRINNGGDYADSILTVTIPCVVPQGHFAMGFYYDEETGELEGIPILAVNDNNVVLATRHFATKHLNEATGGSTVRAVVWADIMVSSIEMSKLFHETQKSGFKPGINDWEFTNRGSFIAPKGHCAGQSITAMWYYNTRQLRFGEPTLYGRFSTLPNPIWEDNRNGYRFASVVQNIYRNNNFNQFLSFIWKSNTSKISEDSLHYLGFAYSMRLTQRPQYVSISIGNQGHALIAYRTSPNVLSVADPNLPGIDGPFIEFIDGKFRPYPGSPNASEPQVLYSRILYFAQSALVSSEGIAEQYDKMLKGTIGDGPPYQFPRYQLIYHDGKDWQPLPKNLNTGKDTITIAADCFDCPEFWPGPGKLTDIALVKSTGENVRSDHGFLRLALNLGQNLLPIVINGDPITKESRYIDFMMDTINRNFGELSITPNPINGAPDQEIELTAKSISTPPSSANYVWTFGDGTTETILNKNTVKHKFAKAGDFLVTVKLYDNSTNKLLSVGTAPAKIAGSIEKTFNYDWIQKASTKDWYYDLKFKLSGTVDGKNGNKVEQITASENNKLVNIKFTNIDSFMINFTSSFSVTPTQIVSSLDPNEVLTFQGTPRLSWSTSNFVPGASQNVGFGTFQNAKSQGTITIKGSMDYQSVSWSDLEAKYVTYNGVLNWVLAYIELDKF